MTLLLARLGRTVYPTTARRSLSYTVPIVLESGALGERSFDIYSRLLRERIICVHGEVVGLLIECACSLTNVGLSLSCTLV